MANQVGLGDPNGRFKVYIANRPNYANYSNISNVQALEQGQIQAIGQACGNGWRKVFNLYAKLVFALNQASVADVSLFECWQDYRDKKLLALDSNTSLLFSKPNLSESGWHIVMGKAYGNQLQLPSSLHWIDKEFAIDEQNKLIVCPYFDYRQLSNVKLIHLVELIHSLK